MDQFTFARHSPKWRYCLLNPQNEIEVELYKHSTLNKSKLISINRSPYSCSFLPLAFSTLDSAAVPLTIIWKYSGSSQHRLSICCIFWKGLLWGGFSALLCTGWCGLAGAFHCWLALTAKLVRFLVSYTFSNTEMFQDSESRNLETVFKVLDAGKISCILLSRLLGEIMDPHLSVGGFQTSVWVFIS